MTLALTAAATLAAVAGCSGDTASMARPLPASALLADSNRDGVVDDRDRVAGKAGWSPSAGALFLANLDDDDGDGMADAKDAVVNGDADDKDLARIRLAPWPTAPMTATATITVAGSLTPAAINLFRKDAAGWSPVALPATLKAADVIAGVEFGIEAKDFVQSLDPGLAGSPALVTDAVALRVAPYVMVSNLSPIFDVWNAHYGDRGGIALLRDLQQQQVALINGSPFLKEQLKVTIAV